MLQIEKHLDSAYPGDQGGGKARLDPETMLALHVSPGELISISGKRKTVVKVWRSLVEDWNKNKVRIDAFTRKNANVEIGDKIILSPIEEVIAKQVHFSSPSPTEIVQIQNISRIKNTLTDFPIENEDIVPILTRFPSDKYEEIKIIKVIPNNANIISSDTKLVFDDSIKITKEKIEDNETDSISPLIIKFDNSNKKMDSDFVIKSIKRYTSSLKNDQKIGRR